MGILQPETNPQNELSRVFENNKITKRELEAAEAARRMYVIMGRPGMRVFETMIRTGLLLNTPITT
jgi:hypothetical protein